MNSLHILQTELLFNLDKDSQWKSSTNTMKVLGLLGCVKIHITKLSDSHYFNSMLWWLPKPVMANL